VYSLIGCKRAVELPTEPEHIRSASKLCAVGVGSGRLGEW